MRVVPGPGELPSPSSEVTATVTDDWEWLDGAKPALIVLGIQFVLAIVAAMGVKLVGL